MAASIRPSLKACFLAAIDLHALGHVTVFFDGATGPGLPGAIHVAGDGEIVIEPGMIFQITD